MRHRYVNNAGRGSHGTSAFMAGKSSSSSRTIETVGSMQAREVARVEVMVGVVSQRLHLNLG